MISVKAKLFLTAFLFLSACGAPPETAESNPTAPSNKGSEGYRLTPNANNLNFVGHIPVMIEARSGGTGSWKLKKLIGTCHLKSSAFTASVGTWKSVLLPSFGAETPDMTVTCNVQGRETKTKIIKSVNLTRRHYNSKTAAHALVGLGIVGAVATASAASQRDKTKDLFGYPPKIDFNYGLD
ncbi:hypothetical protein [Thalassovita sp.]|uniref:hypothetical protein n=1 Tax=Thalassovita sp. TaxID=1979401 RepID=UPI002AB30621|nr:hypothetical protein [Thalassovita sp.]